MGGQAAIGAIGEFESAAFARLRPRLLAQRELVAPFVDPQALAKGALLASDALRAPEVMKKVRSAASIGLCDVASLEELGSAARALLFVLRRIEASSHASVRGAPVSDAQLDEADTLRRKLVDAVETHLVDDDEARLWLEIARQPAEVLDIVFDLRNLARALRRHGSELDAKPELASVAALIEEAERVAGAIERTVDPWDARTEWNDWLARAWTYLVPLYEEALRVGRFVLRGPGGIVVPSLVAIARRARKTRSATKRMPAGSVPPPARSLTMPAVDGGRVVTPPPLPRIVVPPPIPAPTISAPVEEDWSALATSLPPASVDPALAEPALAEPALAESAPVETASVEPAPVEERTRASRPSMRVGARHEVELEVGLFGDSNFYVGFTENLSDGGVFVATYMTKPIGSRVELAVRLPGLGEPMKLRGEVRWVREPSSSDEVWPGMGIRFEDVGAEDERRIRAFLTQREPLFYDE